RARPRDVYGDPDAMRRRVALAAAAALGLVALAIPARVPAQAPASSVAKAKGDGNQPLTVDADRMERLGKESLVIFTGNVGARQNDDSVSGDTTTIDLSEEPSVGQGGRKERVKAVFYPREEGKQNGQGRRPGESCND